MKKKNQDNFLSSFENDFMEELEDGRFILSRTDSFVLRCIAISNDTNAAHILRVLLEKFITPDRKGLEDDMFRK